MVYAVCLFVCLFVHDFCLLWGKKKRQRTNEWMKRFLSYSWDEWTTSKKNLWKFIFDLVRTNFNIVIFNLHFRVFEFLWPLIRTQPPFPCVKSISPAFYAKLLLSKIPKCKKTWATRQSFCAFGICIKASCKHFDEIDPRRKFHQHFTRAFFVQNFGAKNYKTVLWVWNILVSKYWSPNESQK